MAGLGAGAGIYEGTRTGWGLSLQQQQMRQQQEQAAADIVRQDELDTFNRDRTNRLDARQDELDTFNRDRTNRLDARQEVQDEWAAILNEQKLEWQNQRMAEARAKFNEYQKVMKQEAEQQENRKRQLDTSLAALVGFANDNPTGKGFAPPALMGAFNAEHGTDYDGAVLEPQSGVLLLGKMVDGEFQVTDSIGNDQVARLTTLFNEVRYGAQTAAQMGRDAASAALNRDRAIKEAEQAAHRGREYKLRLLRTADTLRSNAEKRKDPISKEIAENQQQLASLKGRTSRRGRRRAAEVIPGVEKRIGELKNKLESIDQDLEQNLERLGLSADDSKGVSTAKSPNASSPQATKQPAEQETAENIKGYSEYVKKETDGQTTEGLPIPKNGAVAYVNGGTVNIVASDGKTDTFRWTGDLKEHLETQGVRIFKIYGNR